MYHSLFYLQKNEKYPVQRVKVDNQEDLVTQNGSNCGIRASMNFKSSRSHYWTTPLKLTSLSH